MIRDFSYQGDLAGGSLQVRESRVVAELLLQNASEADWQQAIMTDNRLQKRSPATARRVAQALRKRLELLEAPFWQALLNGDDELATQVALCSALERNLLLVEFMETVVSDAYITQAATLDAWQWDDFLQDRVHRDPAIADWTTSSKKKMGQVALRILAEVGYLKNTRSLQLQHVLIRPEVRTLLEDSYRHRILACLRISSPRSNDTDTDA
ncbi:MAG: DUF1819 family protein [Porphyromonadaceae bacterium]|nr:DUF1819 family protein [Porphyromonadaceae bacterium]